MTVSQVLGVSERYKGVVNRVVPEDTGENGEYPDSGNEDQMPGSAVLSRAELFPVSLGYAGLLLIKRRRPQVLFRESLFEIGVGEHAVFADELVIEVDLATTVVGALDQH